MIRAYPFAFFFSVMVASLLIWWGVNWAYETRTESMSAQINEMQFSIRQLERENEKLRSRVGELSGG